MSSFRVPAAPDQKAAGIVALLIALGLLVLVPNDIDYEYIFVVSCVKLWSCSPPSPFPLALPSSDSEGITRGSYQERITGTGTAVRAFSR